MKKLLLLSTSLTTCAFFAPVAMANPEGGVVVGGAATIESGVNRVDVHQSTNRAVIDWRSFNIEQGETTQFHQPSSSSMTVNRVNDTNSSKIMGSLKANGNVVVINQSGILFGPKATVDVNSLVATTSDITNADAMAGNMQFYGAGNASASVINEGTISAQEAGLVGLVAPRVENNGIINARLGKVHLASGDKFTVDLYGDGALNIVASDAMQEQLVSNKGTISAEGGVVQITAAAGAQLVTSVVQLDGEIKAPSAVEQNGRIIISGHDDTAVSITGSLDTSGATGGDISITGKNILQQGTITANGTSGKGGNIGIQYKSAYLDNENSKVEAKGTDGNGGNIAVKGKTGSRAFVSGKYDASSSTAKGGKVQITAAQGDVKLYGAKVHADGKTGGGTVHIGGEYQGGGTLEHSLNTSINFATILSADATDTGKGGDVIVWSDNETKFGGTAYARGGANGGDGGLIELSSKDTLQISDAATTVAAARKTGYAAGQLLLDPKNITIASGGISDGISYFEFIDPNPDAGSFGGSHLVLQNGNVYAADYLDDLIATDSGAAYLFNGVTGALISTVTGSRAGDQVGEGGNVYELTNGNYVLISPNWDNGMTADVGAVTWGSATLGVSGSVSTSNSFVGAAAGEHLSQVYTLTNGNYLVSSMYYGDYYGAIAWADGNGGTVGVISSANALVGSQQYDSIGSNSIYALSNGNYFIGSQVWDNGGIADVGAITIGNGNGGTVGVISAANSLIGSTAGDMIGSDQWGTQRHILLSNGNVVIGSSSWDNAGIVDAGAITFINTTTGLTGTISSANSFVGSTENDYLGTIYNFIELGNDKFVVAATEWDNAGIVDAGAVIMGSTITGGSGVVSSANAMVGSTAGDRIGSGDGMWVPGLVALTNNNFVVVSSLWDEGAVEDAGAVTWVNGTTGLVGTLSSTNSLVGSTDFDQIGSTGVVALSNGNYVVGSSLWDNGLTVDVGAATWANGTTGRTGAISSSNSLVGSSANDGVGNIAKLSSGNYLLLTSLWDDGGVADVGAVTLVNGTTGLSGFVDATNSIIGTTAGDQIGSAGAVSVGTGNFVFISPNWDNGMIVDSGAATWLQESAGTHGTVSISNSLYSSTANSLIGEIGWVNNRIVVLPNGNYIIFSEFWDNGAIVDASAVTWGDGNTGVFGAITEFNSLIGSTTDDKIGGSAFEILTNGNFIIGSSVWDNGSIVNAGALTWGNGTTGVRGVLSAQNSVVGSQADDQVSWQDWGNATVLPNGDYILNAIFWDNGAIADAGAFMLIDGTNGSFGEITSYNAILGTESNGYYWPGDDRYDDSRYVFANRAEQKMYSIELGTHEILDSYNSYGDMAGASVTLSPNFITQVLNTGTSVTLQANNDITVSDDIIVSNRFGDGGTLTFQAGRSILLNAYIATDDGDLNLFANEDLSTGVVNAHRDAGAAVITMALGSSIDTGTGAVNIRLDNGAGKTNATAGSITLRDITAGTIFAHNMNTSGDVIVQSGTLSASEAGDAITLVSGRNFINNSGAGALDATTGRWLVYSTNPAADTIGSLANDFRRFSCTYGGSCPAMPGGTNNGLLYSYTPILTVTPDDLAVIQYGDAVPSLTGYSYTLDDYLGGDAGDDVIGGSLNGSTTYTVGSGVNSYNVNHASGALTSALGYGFSYLNNATAITVDKKDITASFNAALTKVYGNANPTINYSNFTFTGLVGSDSESLFTSVTPNFGAVNANTAVSVGNAVSATIGSTANYNVTNSPSTTLSITQRALTVVTNGVNKILPAGDPTFSGSNNLTAHDAALISWAYAPQAYGGLEGSYTIEATATDASSRLGNYVRTNNYGTFIVYPVGTVISPPPTENQSSMPDTVTYMSLGGYLRDVQGVSSSSSGNGSLQGDDDKPDIESQLAVNTQEGDGADVQKAGNDLIRIHPKLKKFLMNPFAMLIQE